LATPDNGKTCDPSASVSKLLVSMKFRECSIETGCPAASRFDDPSAADVKHLIEGTGASSSNGKLR
jgi:hypothetical protein